MCILVLAFAKDYLTASILIIIAEGLAGLSTAGIYRNLAEWFEFFFFFALVEYSTIIASFNAIHNIIILFDEL